MNLFKKNHTQISFPEKIIFIEELPIWGKYIQFTHNKDRKTYATDLKLPFVDHDGNILKSSPICTTEIPELYFMIERSRFLTLEEYDNYNFNKTRIELLKDLVSKFEKL